MARHRKIVPTTELRGDHPLKKLKELSKLRTKELAAELEIKTEVLTECFRFRSSIRDTGANRLLIEKFGVRPETTWGDGYHSLPLNLVKGPFTHLWWDAWKSTVTGGLEECKTIIFQLAQAAWISDRKVRWWNAYLLGQLQIGENALQELTKNDPLLAEKLEKLSSTDRICHLARIVAKKDAILSGKGAKKFASFPGAVPTDRETTGIAIVHGLREYERYYPDECRMIVEHGSF